MASSGWLNEQWLTGWGYNGQFICNLFINGIERYWDGIHIWGTQRLMCRGSYTYYANNIYSSWNNWDWGEIKPWTGYTYIGGWCWDKWFDHWIGGMSYDQTSWSFPTYYEDVRTWSWLHETRWYTVYFDRYAAPPSGLYQSATRTSYTGCSTACAGINWGYGYNVRHLWLDMVWTNANGQRQSFRMADWWNDACGTSKVWESNTLNIPTDCNVEFWWNAETNIGGDKDNCTTIWYPKSYPEPSLSNATATITNVDTYKISTSISGIDYKYNYTNPKLECIIKYSLDGKDYEYTAYTSTNGETSKTVSIDATSLAPTEPWTKVPEDNNIDVYWKVSTSNGSTTLKRTKKTLPQYSVYLIDENIDSGTPVECEMKISNVGGSSYGEIRRLLTI